MRLAAIYIPEGILTHVFGKDHRGQTINLGGKYIYTLEDNNDLASVSKKVLNPEYIDDFWKPISLFSAIVGANGTGKSSLLNVFRNRSFCSLVYEDNTGKEEITYIENSYQNYIYYSPHLELIESDYENGNFWDVSPFPRMVDDTEDENLDLTSLLELHDSERIKRWMKFIKKEGIKELLGEIELPVFQKIKIKLRYFSISVSDTPYQYRDFFEKFKEIGKYEQDTQIHSIIETDNIAHDELGKTNKFNSIKLKTEIIQRVIDKIQIIFESNGNTYLGEGYINNDLSTSSPEFLKFEDSLLDSFYWFLEHAYLQLTPKAEKIWLPKNQIKKLIETLLKYIPENDQIDNWTEMNVSFDAAFEILNAYEEFLIAFKDDLNYNKKILLKFNPDINLSSGEKGMYNLFSSIHDLNYRIEQGVHSDYHIFNKRESLEEGYLILLDEGDLGFHPQWKKKYVNALIEILPQIIDNPNIQIILTTHDPLTLSDIPKHNSIYLDKNEKGSSIICDKMDNSSFGANIHNLLYDNFFLKGGHIGDFAKLKINNVISLLNSYIDLRNENGEVHIESTVKDNLFVTINMIGDTIVRKKLVDMYFEAFSDDTQKLNTEISNLEQQLSRLKKRRKDDID
jgi:hypothetical protein